MFISVAKYVSLFPVYIGYPVAAISGGNQGILSP